MTGLNMRGGVITGKEVQKGEAPLWKAPIFTNNSISITSTARRRRRKRWRALEVRLSREKLERQHTVYQSLHAEEYISEGPQTT
jgi:hypothetical protein